MCLHYVVFFPYWATFYTHKINQGIEYGTAMSTNCVGHKQVCFPCKVHLLQKVLISVRISLRSNSLFDDISAFKQWCVLSPV